MFLETLRQNKIKKFKSPNPLGFKGATIDYSMRVLNFDSEFFQKIFDEKY